MDLPGTELDEEKDIETAEQHRIDREEVAGQQRRRLCSQELRPGRGRPSRSGLDAMAMQDYPHARGREPDSHCGQLPVDPPIAPGRMLIRQAKDQRDRASRKARSSRPSMSVGPLLSHQIPMPTQQRLGLDKEPSSANSRQKPAQSSEYCSIRWLQGRTHHLSAQDSHLVAEHDDLNCQSCWPLREGPTGGDGRSPVRRRRAPRSIFVT